MKAEEKTKIISKEKCLDCEGTGYIYHPELGHRVFEPCHCDSLEY